MIALDTFIPGLALLLLLGGSAFFSSAEVALFSLTPLHFRKLRRIDPPMAERLHTLLHPPTRFLSTILIGNTLINVLLATFGYAWLAARWPGHADWLIVGLLTVVLLLFGEVLPKRCAFLWPLQMARGYARPLTWIMTGLTPMRHGLELITQRFASAFQARGRVLSDEEFETVLDVSAEAGVLQPDEGIMLKSVLRLESLQARDVMTPRVDLIGYDLNDGPDILLTTARQAKVRQIVLYRGDIDNVEGVADVRAFLLDPNLRLQSARLPLHFVPESATLDHLLKHFITQQQRVAVVVDEYGGTAGLITRGDILEEITGDLDDEHNEHRLLFERVAPQRWLLDGQVSLEEVNARLDADLSAEGTDRLAGWVAAKLERLPRPGDAVTAQGFHAVVHQMRRHRITLVMLEQLPDADATTPEATT